MRLKGEVIYARNKKNFSQVEDHWFPLTPKGEIDGIIVIDDKGTTGATGTRNWVCLMRVRYEGDWKGTTK